MSKVDLARRFDITPAAVSYSVQRGEKMVKKRRGGSWSIKLFNYLRSSAFPHKFPIWFRLPLFQIFSFYFQFFGIDPSTIWCESSFLDTQGLSSYTRDSEKQVLITKNQAKNIVHIQSFWDILILWAFRIRLSWQISLNFTKLALDITEFHRQPLSFWCSLWERVWRRCWYDSLFRIQTILWRLLFLVRWLDG